jgi:hypothetical protein
MLGVCDIIKMKIDFKQKFSSSGDFLVRRCGYGQIRDKTGQVSYVRRLRSGFYPRFHLYINSENPLVLNLHLDQKKPSYKGYLAHGGDYDSEIVKREAERVYETILREGQEERESQEEKEGFWSRLFGKKK